MTEAFSSSGVRNTGERKKTLWVDDIKEKGGESRESNLISRASG